ncbi:MAG TPA: PP2C family protein-serine/threonine phosphatase [Solirubrobacteraceae bacterium]|nr:PP2C family protein-serine/threonine phosphatase [Solirubrobacteraceae bacterium]
MTEGGPVSGAGAGPAQGTEGEHETRLEAATESDRRWPYSLPVGVLFVGLILTGVLVWISASTYSNNEKRLLKSRVGDAGALFAGAFASIQTPLASAAALADATGGETTKFMQFIGPYTEGKTPTFGSVTLWRLGANQTGPIAAVGKPSELSATPSRAEAFFAHTAATRSRLGVIGLLTQPQRRLGYAFTSPGLTGRYVVYAESNPLPRRSKFQRSSTFTDLHYALYLGNQQRPEDLLVTDLNTLPMTGQTASISIPFGSNSFTFMVSAKQSLVGSFPQRLPWLIVIVGVLLSIGAALLTLRLIQRRNHAEQLATSLEQIADENRRLYSEQRSIAQTLQHALLPEALPKIHGVETSARYEAGVEGVDIGGDWYDLIALDDHRLLLVVGDVSGRGLRAAATMASLRYAIHAYAAQNDPPEIILTKLSKLVSVGSSGQLATILCALVDVEAHTLTVTSAGHLPPLLISDGTGTFIKGAVGVPIGVKTSATYTSTAVSTPPAATLLAFTDGLVERRGESIDAGLERLQHAATANHSDLDGLLSRLLELRHDSDDDTAIAGLRWLD